MTDIKSQTAFGQQFAHSRQREKFNILGQPSKFFSIKSTCKDVDIKHDVMQFVVVDLCGSIRFCNETVWKAQAVSKGYSW